MAEDKSPQKTSRRQFLKTALKLTAGTAAISALGLGRAAVLKDEYDEHRTLAQAENKAATPPPALIDFVRRPEQVRLIGIDHHSTQADLYAQMSSPEFVQALKDTDTKKVFIEMNTYFSGLMEAAPDMPFEIFMQLRLGAYPNGVAWFNGLHPQDQFSFLKSEEALHTSLVKLNENGIQVIPYDGRHKADPATIEKENDEILAHEQKVLKEARSRLGPMDTAKFAVAMALGGFEEAAKTRIKTDEGIRNDMLLEKNADYLKGQENLDKVFANEESNLQNILCKCAPNERIVVAAGHMHVTRKNAIRQKMTEKGLSVTSLCYMPEDMPGEVNSYIDSLKRDTGSLAPDFVLSQVTGKIVDTKASPEPARNESAPARNALQRLRHQITKALSPQ